jgi:hypothetical protein
MSDISPNEHPKVFIGIKSILSGDNAISFTEKSVKYKIFHKIGARSASKKGCVYYFIDSGDICNLTKYSYNLADKTKKTEIIWFRISKNRLIASTGNFAAKRNISNRLGLKLQNFCAVSNGSKILNCRNKVEKLLKKWCARHKLGNSKSKLIDIVYPNSNNVFDCLKQMSPDLDVPSFISRELIGCKGYNQFLNRMAGFHGKKLKKILSAAGHPEKILALAKIVKNLISESSFYDLIENDNSVSDFIYPGLHHTHKEIMSFRYFLRNFSEKTICKFLKDSCSQFFLKDTCFQYFYWNADKSNEVKIILPENSNDLKHIHDSVSRDYNRLSRIKKETPIDYEKNLNKLKWSDIQNDKYRIYAPKTLVDLINAGTSLSNCLASYKNHHTQRSLILLVEKKGKLSFAIEKDFNNQIIQFVAKSNQPPQPEEKQEILSLLKLKA